MIKYTKEEAVREAPVDESTRQAIEGVHQRIDKMQLDYAQKFENLIAAQTETHMMIKMTSEGIGRLEILQRESSHQQIELRDSIRDLIANNGVLVDKIDRIGAVAFDSAKVADGANKKAEELSKKYEYQERETKELKAIDIEKEKRWWELKSGVIQTIAAAVLLTVLVFALQAIWESFKTKVNEPAPKTNNVSTKG